MTLVVAFGHAMNMHYIHSLAKKVNPFVNMWYSHIGFLFANSLMSNIYPFKLEQEGVILSLLLLIVLISIATVITQYGIILANSIKAPPLVMPFGYVSVLVGFCADVYLFETEFSLLPILGILLTSSGLLSGYLI